MSQALVALLPFLLIHARALRPQEDAGQDQRFTSNWGTPGTSWLELGEQPRGNTSREDARTLAVGHSASLQLQAIKKRLATEESLADAGFALAQFALAGTGHGPHGNGSEKAVLATPSLQTKEPPDSQAIANQQHPQRSEPAESKPTDSGVDSNQTKQAAAPKARFRVGQRVRVVAETRPTWVETTVGMIGTIVQDKSDHGWSQPYEVQFDNGRSEWYQADWIQAAPEAEQPSTQIEEAQFRIGQRVRIAPGKDSTVPPRRIQGSPSHLFGTIGMVGTAIKRSSKKKEGQYRYLVDLEGSKLGIKEEWYSEDWLEAAAPTQALFRLGQRVKIAPGDNAAILPNVEYTIGLVGTVVQVGTEIKLYRVKLENGKTERYTEDWLEAAPATEAAKSRTGQQETATLAIAANSKGKAPTAAEVEQELTWVDNGGFPLSDDTPLTEFEWRRRNKRWERNKADTEDGSGMEQEMDDLIGDVEEIERVSGIVIRKIEKFWSEEGFRHIVLNLGVYFAGIFISLGLYATCFRHRDTKLEQEFRYGACECLGDGRVCLCGLCCPAIRWADTISEEKGGFLDFNSALLVMMGLGFTLLCPYTGVFAWIGIVVIGVYYRQKIRLRYGLEADTIQSYVEDTLIWCCCAWCAICQEARQVDEETEEVEEPANDPSNPKISRAGSTSW